MLDLWYSEYHTEKTKFSIQVNKHIYTETSPFQKIDFFTSDDFGTFFTLDGLMMVNEKDEFIYHDMITHVPMATNPDAKKVLVIGGGDGGTVRELTRYNTIEQIDMVEIDEAVVRACQKYLTITSNKLEDSRVNLYFTDGIEYIKNKENYYDMILVDSTDPIGPGEGLFTRAFYQDCYNALTINGILVNQHESPYYARDVKAMKKAHNKIKQIFPISKVYQFHMPTYPSGHWLFGFASKNLDPVKDIKKERWEDFGIKTKYYNTDLHIGCFALPTYVKELLEQDE